MLNWTRKKDKIGGAINSTFLDLIPKEKNPLLIDRFRPISLCNTSYKILTKILSIRMKKSWQRLFQKLKEVSLLVGKSWIILLLSKRPFTLAWIANNEAWPSSLTWKTLLTGSITSFHLRSCSKWDSPIFFTDESKHALAVHGSLL